MKKGRKRLIGVIVLLCMLLVIGILLAKTVFVVRSVQVIGNHSYSENDIVRASGIQFGDPLSRVDAGEIEKAVNATGKLKFESVESVFPNKVRLYVSERKPAAMLLHVGSILVLDRDGCVIETRNQVPNEDLIYISDLGVENYRIGSTVYGDDARLKAYAAVMEAIDHHTAGGMVSEINFMNKDDIRIITRSGITVSIGDSEKARDKIAWMKAVAADLEHRGETGGMLDVSSATKADYTPAGILQN